MKKLKITFLSVAISGFMIFPVVPQLVYASDSGTSNVVQFALPQYDPPVGLDTVMLTPYGVMDGMITGTDNTMEYKLSTAATWIPVEGDCISGLAAGVYEVRKAADAEHLASNAVELTVKAPLKVLAGSDRYATAVEISKDMYDSADAVVLATGYDFPDALAAGPLAYQKNAPILLTDKNTIPKVTLDEIKRLDPSTVYIIGSEQVISSAVFTAVDDVVTNVVRVHDTNRYGTAVAVADELTGTPDTAVLAYGWNFPDALSIGSYAALNGYPILLTDTAALADETDAYLDATPGITNIIIVGGTNIISQDIENDLDLAGYNVTRYAGSDRFDTCARVAQAYFAGAREAVVANGWNFPDALAAVPYAANLEIPILLVQDNSITRVIDDYILYPGHDFTNFIVVGGNPAVGTAPKNRLLELLYIKYVARGYV